MRQLLTAIVLSLGLSLSAQAAAPSRDSIEKLLAVTEAEKTIATLMQQVNGMMKSSFDQMIGARTLSAEQRQQAESFAQILHAKMTPLLAEELAWERMKELSVHIYSKAFSQEEIDGLIAFYQSPTGRAFVEKMPLVMQQSMLAMQERLGPMMQKMQRIAEDTAAEFKAKQDSAKR